MAEYVPSLDERVAFHLIGKHCDGLAICRSPADNADQHKHEHDGPCTIRNHPRHSVEYDPEIVEAVLEELEADE